MSEHHVDNNLEQVLNCLAEVSSMGNLFSKEDELEGQVSQKETSLIEETRSSILCSPPIPIVADADQFFKFFDKATAEDPSESEVDETEVLESEKVILNAFLNEVRNAKPTPLRNWSALQHYVYFIYRHVISPKPCNSSDIFPNIVTKKIRDLVEGLLREDITQLCIRLLTLIREYALVARGNFVSFQVPKATTYLVRLMSYYSAFCSAASKLAPLIPEFDFVVMERFNINWLCINKSIFYHHIYMTPSIQSKIPLFLKLKEENKPSHKSLLESYACFTEDMTLLGSRWATLKLRISTMSQQRALSDPAKHLVNDWKMFAEHKKILNTNYWIIRSTQAMQIQDMAELDAHIISLVENTSQVADLLIDSQGHCLCEDCLAAEFRSSSMSIPSSFQAQSSTLCRLITCYICQDPIALDALASHIVTKHHESPSQKPTRVYLTPHQKRLFCPKKSPKVGDCVKTNEAFPFEGLFEKNTELKESILKIVNGCPPLKTNPTVFETENQESSFKVDENPKFCADIKEVFQPPIQLPKELVLNTTDTEELKHKPAASRASETIFPFKLSASPIFQTSESSFKMIKEPVFKVASEAPIMPSTNEVMFKGVSKPNEDVQSCKTALDEFLKKRNENSDVQAAKNVLHDCLKWKNTDMANRKATEVLKKSAELFSNKDVPKSIGERSGGESLCRKPSAPTLNPTNLPPNSSDVENSAFRKPQQKGISTVDPKMFEFLKTANSQKSFSNIPSRSNDNTCLGHACGHKCKQEDDKQTDVKKHSCQDTCEHHKESRKCDCAYCEVFGSSLPPHTHKTNETRDRLRTRLNQRKEKINDGINKGTSKVTPIASKLNSKTNSNCTIKISSNSKISILNGKGVNVNTTSTKINVKSVFNDTDMRVPPRVPEVVHPVSPPINPKPVLTSADVKRSSSSETPLSSIQRIAVGRSVPICSTERSVNDSNLRSSSSLSNSSLNSDNVDSRDINELLNYIEGNKTIDKAVLAQKKAAKKARQRLKKAQERERAEKEKRLKEEARLREEKRKEEERHKAELLAKQLADKQKRIKKNQEDKLLQQQKQETKKNGKKKGKNHSEGSIDVTKRSNLIEETIPAMVTIKRVAEGSNSPATVTITLKGSTPESDKLLFTLVNGHNSKEHVATATINSDKAGKAKTDPAFKILSQNGSSKTGTDSQKNAKKKKKKETNDQSATKELKVTIAVNKNNANKKDVTNKKSVKLNDTAKVIESKVSKNSKEADKISQSKSVNNVRDDINLPMLRLPPGITITKIEGPPTNRNKASSNNSSAQNNQSPNVPVSKSGVIVVDTEKLIQQSISVNNTKKTKKKNKKKHQKAEATETNDACTDKGNANGSGSPMVTLKNPIFHTLQTALCNKVAESTDSPVFQNNQQASIFKNENGMVTIRSPRLQNPFENGSPISNFLTDLKPMFGPEVPSSYVPMCHTNFPENNKKTPFNAQEILSGLPGIEITKVDKTNPKNETEHKKVAQPAEVSIIPTSNGANGIDKFNFDKDDWPFESVFAPRDVLEEDMDAEERELEAFKRFCQQSVPPERKEKVAHLNVKDIILKKKDVTYS